MMMKRPKQRQDESQKTKLCEPSYDSDKYPPRFSFRLITKDTDFNFKSLDQKHKVSLIDRMNILGNIPWKDLRVLDRASGYEIIKRDQLRFTVPNEVPSDCHIIRFRFGDKVPMLGYRSGFGTFYIIAFDTKFIAYDHG
jgi:hypothetical protein